MPGPAPDAAAPPGMCPLLATKAAGGAGGDGSGSGAGSGGGGTGGGPGGDGDGAAGDDKSGGCGEGDPICPITGRMFVTIFDFGYPGPVPLRWVRHYDSRASDRDGDFGWGWGHTFGWRLRTRRKRIEVFDHRARRQIFHGVPGRGQVVTHPLGWTLRGAGDGFVVDEPTDALSYEFGPDLGDGEHHLVAVRDDNGNRITLQRDDRGRLVGLVDSAGRPYRIHNDDRGHITQVEVATEPSHQRWLVVARYTYDADGNLASVTDAGGYQGRYRYDRHLLVEHRTPHGLSYFYRYDGRTAKARCVETWGEFPGRVDEALDRPIPSAVDGQPDRRPVKGIHYRRMTYIPSDRYCEVVDGRGGVAHYFGDDLGRATRIVDTAGGVTERHYHPEHGGLVGESEPDGNARAIRHDAYGQPIGALDEGGRGRTRELRADGHVVDRDERDGTEIDRLYDERGNLRFIRHPDGTVEEWEVDERGLWSRHIHRDGTVTLYEHDAMGNVVRITHPAPAGGPPRVETNTYDYLGRRIAHVDWNGRRTEWEWDDRNEIVVKRHHDGTEVRVTYDANRNPIRIDNCGHVTEKRYGGMGWLIEMVEPGGRVTQYRYDTEGDIVRVRNPRGQEFTFDRDATGRAQVFTTFEGVRHDIRWGPSEESTIANVAGTAQLTYDARGQLAGVVIDDGTAITFDRPDDRTFLVDNGQVALATNYDALSRVVRDEQGEHVVDVGWHGGKLASLTPTVGPSVAYRYGRDGDLSTIEAAGTAVEKVAVGGDELLRFGDHLTLRKTYDQVGALVSQVLTRTDPSVPTHEVGTSADPNVLRWSSFEYDARSNLRHETRSDGAQIDYDVTANDQVSERRVSRSGQVVDQERLGYDICGIPRMAGAVYDVAMRPVALGEETLGYDAAGRLVSRDRPEGTWRYHYNALDQLTRVDAPGHVVHMRYDAFGRRHEKRVVDRQSGETHRHVTYVWSNNTLLAEKDELSGRTRTYLRANDEWEPEGHVDVVGGEARTTFYVKQPNGALDYAVDERGNVVWAAETTIFGERRVTIAKTDVTLRMSNQHHDEDVGLTYNRHRWYDARVGQFVTPDPLLLRGNRNPRDYVPNPLVYRDPLGLVYGDDPASYLSKPGKHAKGKNAKCPDTGQAIPGYVDCPDDVLHKGSGFGSDAPSSGSVQSKVNAAGNMWGCHSCGSKTSGYSKRGGHEHWTCDHQPPRTTYSDKTAGAAGDKSAKSMASSSKVRLYPHCKTCSRKQGGHMSGLRHDPKKAVQLGVDAMKGR